MPSPKANILIVEDDAALLEGLRDILEWSGFQTTTASNGLEGLAALEAGPLPDLVISDIMMPRMDGYDFYNAVRARPAWVNVPFIFLTAKGDKNDVHRGKLMGADDYLVKPFDEKDLLVAIQAKLKRRAQLEAAFHSELADLKHAILSSLSHEFRTPLTYIASYSELLSEAGPNLNSREFKDFLDGIRLGSNRLQKLVDDFLLLIELHAGETRQAYERRRLPITDLPILLQKVAAEHTARAAERSVVITTDIPDPLPPVLGDREYLSNAVARLVENGVKFSKKEGGHVTLSAQAVGPRLHIRVADTGIGIRPEDQRQLFNLFHQIGRATQEQQGSGSGLAIALGLVTLHGGTLSVESEFGVGSVFTIELPVTG